LAPTATQKLVERQDTPLRRLPDVSGLGLGLGMTDQVVPSHVSTTVKVAGEVGLLSSAQPTAVHIVVEIQDTPLRVLLIRPGLGLGTTDQVVPSQLSVSVEVVT
jgi:hypothetical protein